MTTGKDYSVHEITRRIMQIKFNTPPTPDDLPLLEWQLADYQQRVEDLQVLIARLRGEIAEAGESK